MTGNRQVLVLQNNYISGRKCVLLFSCLTSLVSQAREAFTLLIRLCRRLYCTVRVHWYTDVDPAALLLMRWRRLAT